MAARRAVRGPEPRSPTPGPRRGAPRPDLALPLLLPRPDLALPPLLLPRPFWWRPDPALPLPDPAGGSRWCVVGVVVAVAGGCGGGGGRRALLLPSAPTAASTRRHPLSELSAARVELLTAVAVLCFSSTHHCYAPPPAPRSRLAVVEAPRSRTSSSSRGGDAKGRREDASLPTVLPATQNAFRVWVVCWRVVFLPQSTVYYLFWGWVTVCQRCWSQSKTDFNHETQIQHLYLGLDSPQ